MFTAIVERFTGLLDDRLDAAAIVPVALWIGATSAMSWLASGRDVTSLTAVWSEAGLAAQLLWSLAFIGVVLLASLLLQAGGHGIIRAFEGYWGPARWLGRLGRLWHRRRVQTDDGLLAADYPLEDADVLPTRIGNVLLSAEDYADRRYGMNAVVVWPRLHRVISDELRDDLAAARRQLELPLNITTLAIVFVVTSLLVIDSFGRADARLLITCVASGTAVAVGGYASAVGAAQAYSALIRTAFDLHREDLAEVLGRELPALDYEERLFWGDLVAFWHGNAPISRR